MVATPVAPKVTVVAPSVPPVVARFAVVPLAAANGLVHGLLASAQAVTVAVAGRQVTLLVGSDNS
ncbi:MAG: hypothetical protein CVU17_01675 [Betaproteobacteria bacterium HGW-Betaproteobacteria-11]|nr:MAG: hypothetical protein CVU17_01675 [Betaproteobacteria bacterium HGW-Betaproteobacteria-11]